MVLISLSCIRIEGLAPAVSHCSGSICNHSHFFKVYEIVNERLVPLMSKCHIFNEQRHEGDERRVQFGYCQPVGPVVS